MEHEDTKDTKTQMLDNLRLINRRIGELLGQKKQMGGSLQPEGINEIEELNLAKNSLIVSFLVLRRQGENHINLEVAGREEDILHPYSRNHLCIVINERPSYITRTDLSHLRGLFSGNILSLIGHPDRFTEESYDAYIKRTMAEMNEISHVADKARYDRSIDGFMKEVELQRLKIELARRVLRVRAGGQVTSEDLRIDYLKDPHGDKNRDLIGIAYYNNHQRWGTHIVAAEYRRNIALQRLVDACGGFDSIGRRRKRY